MPLRDLLEKTWNGNLLFSALVELTYRCNLDCFYCYNDLGQRGETLSDEQYFRFFEGLAAMQVMNLTFTGGEPLAHPSFLALGRKARELGFVLRIKSNGHALRGELAEKVRRELDPFLIEISLHGATAATHDRQTRIAGSFERLMANLAELQGAGPAGQAERHPDPLERKRGRRRCSPWPTGWACACRCRPRSPRATTATWGRCRSRRRTKASAGSSACSTAASRTARRQATCTGSPNMHKNCGAGASGIAVDPFGNVYPCVQWRRPLGNLHQQPIQRDLAGVAGARRGAAAQRSGPEQDGRPRVRRPSVSPTAWASPKKKRRSAGRRRHGAAQRAPPPGNPPRARRAASRPALSLAAESELRRILAPPSRPFPRPAGRRAVGRGHGRARLRRRALPLPRALAPPGRRSCATASARSAFRPPTGSAGVAPAASPVTRNDPVPFGRKRAAAARPDRHPTTPSTAGRRNERGPRRLGFPRPDRDGAAARRPVDAGGRRAGLRLPARELFPGAGRLPAARAGRRAAAQLGRGRESGRAHLFLGPSGAGKTTAARKSRTRGLEVLSDDINACVPGTGRDASVVVEKLPFAGEMAQESTPRQSWPLGSLHRLVQGGHSRDKLRPAPDAGAPALLRALRQRRPLAATKASPPTSKAWCAAFPPSSCAANATPISGR